MSKSPMAVGGDSRVDNFARAVAQGGTRRDMLKRLGALLGGGVLGGVAGGLVDARGAAAASPGHCPPGHTHCSVCISTSSDPNNCGACGNVCPTPPAAIHTCVNGQCGFVCVSGFGNCDGNAANGCETNLMTDPSNCGSCGNFCLAGPGAVATCVNGQCGFGCSPGLVNCDGNAATGCTNLMTDPSNCGACGLACASSQACVAGVCV
jgi:hypothetical protein